MKQLAILQFESLHLSTGIWQLLEARRKEHTIFWVIDFEGGQKTLKGSIVTRGVWEWTDTYIYCIFFVLYSTTIETGVKEILLKQSMWFFLWCQPPTPGCLAKPGQQCHQWGRIRYSNPPQLFSFALLVAQTSRSGLLLFSCLFILFFFIKWYLCKVELHQIQHCSNSRFIYEARVTED